MNVFIKPEIANKYDSYYETELGKKVNEIEERLMSKLLQDIPRKEMLELGCGTGHWTNFFVNQGFQVTAGDISDEMLAFVKIKNIKANIVKFDAEQIPFPDNSFDIIASITMLEFVNNQDKVLSEVKRVLKPGGWFLLGSLNALSELGKNKENDATFKNAQFLNLEELNEKLSSIGKSRFEQGVYFSPLFEILDNLENINNIEPAFIASLTCKEK